MEQDDKGPCKACGGPTELGLQKWFCVADCDRIKMVEAPDSTIQDENPDWQDGDPNWTDEVTQPIW